MADFTHSHASKACVDLQSDEKGMPVPAQVKGEPSKGDPGSSCNTNCFLNFAFSVYAVHTGEEVSSPKKSHHRKTISRLFSGDSGFRSRRLKAKFITYLEIVKLWLNALMPDDR